VAPVDVDGDEHFVVPPGNRRDDAFRTEREITVWVGEPDAVAGDHRRTLLRLRSPC